MTTSSGTRTRIGLSLRSLIRAVFIISALPSAASPATLSLSLVPASQVAASDPISVQIVASGFAAAGVQGIGDFGLSISFDPTIVSIEDVLFGDLLGDPGNFEALTTEDFSQPGIATFNEVSLLDPVDLLTLQASDLAGGIVLATLEFGPVSPGTTALIFSGPILGDQNGVNIPVSVGAGSITVAAPEPATLLIGGISVAILWLARRRHRMMLTAVTCASAMLAVPAPKFGPMIVIKDVKGNDTGVSYTVGTTQLQPTAPKAASTNLITPIKIYNNNAQVQTVVMCLTGESVAFNNGAFLHMLINMVINGGNITCEIPNVQNLAARPERLGSMGCRVFSVPGSKGMGAMLVPGSIDATFVSGNDRTIPMFDAKKLPVAGNFSIVGNFGGVGPTQTGMTGSGVAAGGGWGLVGGHPGVTSDEVNVIVNKKPVAKTVLLPQALDTLGIHIIVLDAADKLTFTSDPAPPPARNVATFNCNKCFGMGPTGGGTGLGQYNGYQLEPLPAAARKGLSSVFANHKVNYNSLKLTSGVTLTAQLHLDTDDTFFADATTQATYSLDSSDLPSGCSISNPSISPGSPFLVSPMAESFLTFDVSCDSTLVTGSAGHLTLTVLNSSDGSILGQQFTRTVAPYPCDVNADGSIDSIDISTILANLGAVGGVYDIDGDGSVTPNDARVCAVQCSLAGCSIPQVP